MDANLESMTVRKAIQYAQVQAVAVTLFGQAFRFTFRDAGAVSKEWLFLTGDEVRR